jgi:hypothetical protein
MTGQVEIDRHKYYQTFLLSNLNGNSSVSSGVIRQDHTRLPDSGWSLFGLADSLREQKKNDESSGLEPADPNHVPAAAG